MNFSISAISFQNDSRLDYAHTSAIHEDREIQGTSESTYQRHEKKSSIIFKISSNNLIPTVEDNYLFYYINPPEMIYT